MTQKMKPRQERLSKAIEPIIAAGVTKEQVIEISRAACKIIAPKAYGTSWNFVYDVIDSAYSMYQKDVRDLSEDELEEEIVFASMCVDDEWDSASEWHEKLIEERSLRKVMRDEIENFQVGDKVRYSGSLTEYHKYIFTIKELFMYLDIECALLQGPRIGIWIERCRVSNLERVDDDEIEKLRGEKET